VFFSSFLIKLRGVLEFSSNRTFLFLFLITVTSSILNLFSQFLDPEQDETLPILFSSSLASFWYYTVLYTPSLSHTIAAFNSAPRRSFITTRRSIRSRSKARDNRQSLFIPPWRIFKITQQKLDLSGPTIYHS